MLEMQFEDYKNVERTSWKSTSIEPAQVELKTKGYRRM